MSNNNEHIVTCESNIQVIPTEQQWKPQQQNYQPQQQQVTSQSTSPQYYIPQYAQYTQQNYQNNNPNNQQQQSPIYYYYQQPQVQIPHPQPIQPVNQPLPITLIQDANDDARKQFNYQSALYFALPQTIAFLACCSDFLIRDFIRISWNYYYFQPQFYLFLAIMILTLVMALTCPKRVKNSIYIFYTVFVITYSLIWQGIFSSSFYNYFWGYTGMYYFGRYMIINMAQIVFVSIGLCFYLKKHKIDSELSKSLGYLIPPAWVIYILALMFSGLNLALLAIFSILASAIGYYVLYILQQINKKGILNLMTNDAKSIGLTIHILLFSPIYDIGAKLE